MNKEDFTIKGDFIELVKLIKVVGLTGTGGEAKMLIENGEVLVNDEVELRKRRKLKTGDKVVIADLTVNLL